MAITYIPLYFCSNWKLIAVRRGKNEPTVIKVLFGENIIDWFSHNKIVDWVLIEPKYISQVIRSDKNLNKKIGDLLLEEGRRIIGEGQVGIEFKNSKDAIRFKLRWC